VEALRRTVEAGFNALNTRLDRVVTNDLFQAYQQAVRREFDDHAREIAELQAGREADKKERDAEKVQRSNDRRIIWVAVFTSIIAPLALMLVQLWLNKGT
jgi:t-SNARE complex subunit (syntaxin)